jgi:hypothetical protein
MANRLKISFCFALSSTLPLRFGSARLSTTLPLGLATMTEGLRGCRGRRGVTRIAPGGANDLLAGRDSLFTAARDGIGRATELS